MTPVIQPGGPIVLVGLMATGKTTVGRALANRLDRQFFDSDATVEARTGHTVAELWERDGEVGFRVFESEALQDALAAEPPGVVAAAGGVVLSADNRACLRRASADGGVVVWLRADPSILARRVRPGDHRPLLAVDPAGTLVKMADERARLYTEVADAIVDVGERSVSETREAVVAVIADVIAERVVAQR